MKVFSTIALLMGSEYAMTIGDVEQFIAGLIFGLVQDDDLAEIQKCLKDGSGLGDEITEAIQDFEQKSMEGVIEGIEEIGKIIQELPADLGDCKNMQGDIDRIEAWAQIFKDPKQLAMTVAKNVMKNYKEIMADGTKTYSDWESSQFYDCGDDVAEILTLTLGAVPKAGAMPESLEMTQW